MLKFLKKYCIPSLIILTFGIFFINWYLHQQDFIQETALIFYQKYFQLNALLSDNLFEGINTLFTSIQTESRNYLFALILRPVYLISKGSNAGYVFGIFILFFIPTVLLISKFINQYILHNSEDAKWFKYITLFFVTATPLFWFMCLVGYPDIFSLFLYIIAILIFYKHPFDQKVPLKIIFLFSGIMYFASLYRRWLIFGMISFLLSAGIYLIIKQFAIKKTSEEIKKSIINILKNITLSGLIFFACIAIIQPEIFKSFFHTEYKAIFDKYSVPIQINFIRVNGYFSDISYLLFIWLLYYLIKFPSKMQSTIFAMINAVTYFFVFNSVQLICYDHMLILIFWILCCLMSAIYTMFISIKSKMAKSIFLIIVFSVSGLYFYDSLVGITQPYTKPFIADVKFRPFSVPNKTIIKTIEQEIKTNIDKDELYTYSIWAFVNGKFNPQLLFQENYNYKYFEKGLFPPLVDEESIIMANCGFVGLIGTNDIYTLDPMLPEYYQQKDTIMYKFAQMLKNKQGFGASYKLSNKKYTLQTGENVIKYTRFKPLTKQEQDETKNMLLSWYPWAKDYYPTYLEDLYKHKKNLYTE